MQNLTNVKEGIFLNEKCEATQHLLALTYPIIPPAATAPAYK